MKKLFNFDTEEESASEGLSMNDTEKKNRNTLEFS
jgi:hypothetical protein